MKHDLQYRPPTVITPWVLSPYYKIVHSSTSSEIQHSPPCLNNSIGVTINKNLPIGPPKEPPNVEQYNQGLLRAKAFVLLIITQYQLQ